jgi:hypothetical protein
MRETMATEFSQDPIINVIHNSIRKGIKVTLENECYASAVVLILSAVDAMAYLAMPESQQDVTKSDFVRWVEEYVRFPGTNQLSGLDLYGARCAMLHSFGARSKMSREGQCRVILWMDNAVPPIIFRPDLAPDHVMVSILALKEAVFAGMDRFLINLYRDPNSKQAKLADKRFESFVHKMPADYVTSTDTTA